MVNGMSESKWVTLPSGQRAEDGSDIVVWFSCGAASAVAAKKTVEIYGDRCNVRLVNSPIKEEDQDNRRFLHDVERWIGVEIEEAINPKFPAASCVEVWEGRKFMSGVNGAPCTLELKKRARYHWQKNNNADYHVLGFTADEQNRYRKFILSELDNVIPVLIDENITKEDCFRIIDRAGILLPSIYRNGFPNANCIGCVKATSPTYWNHVRAIYPKVFEERAEQSARIGALSLELPEYMK